jgi:hypothetical protein
MYDELLSVPLVVRVPGREGRWITHPFSLGWLHEIVTELGEVDTPDMPLTSSYGSHFEMESTPEEILLADSIDQQGHSVVARQEMSKYIVQTDELANKTGTEMRTGPSGHYRLNKDPKERKATNESSEDLVQAAHEVVVEPDEIRKQTRNSTVNDATIDHLKQLGYAGE